MLLVAGVAALIFHGCVRTLNRSLTGNDGLVMLSTYIIPAIMLASGVVLLVRTAL